MTKYTRIILGVGALCAALALLGVSIAANVKFARSFGSSDLDRNILSGASIASDLFKSVAVAVLFWMISKRRWVGALSIAVLGVIALSFSLMSATGFVAGERFHAFYEATVARDNTRADQARLKDREADRGWLPTKKPLPVIQAEIDGMQLDPSWRATGGCTQAITVGRREAFCRRLAELRVEHAAALTAAAEDARIAADRKDLREHGRAYGDPLVETIKAFIGVDERSILLGLIILSVLLIEVGSALGLPVALALLAPERTTQVLSAPASLRAPQFTVRPLQEPIVEIVRAAPPSAPQASQDHEPAAKPPPRVHKINPARSFDEPAADRPVVGGLRSRIRRATPEEVAALVAAAKKRVA